MADPAVAWPLLAVVALAPSLKLSAAFLVPAHVTWRMAWVASAAFAVLAVPSIWLFYTGHTMLGYWWLLGAMAVHCFSAGWHIRHTRIGGRELGFRQGSELVMLALAISATSGVVIWSQLQRVVDNAP